MLALVHPSPCKNSWIDDDTAISPIANKPVQLRQACVNKYDFSINAYHRDDLFRSAVEQFIIDGFQKVYGAKMSVTMPVLLAIQNGAFKAALGIRSASQALFIEQYLDHSIEQCLADKGHTVTRDDIVEIGHLYSNKAKFALPLLLTTGVSLYMNHYRYIVFCATSHVRQLIEGAGIRLNDLGSADKRRLVTTDDHWGSYYDTCPRVIAISTHDIIQAIIHRPAYLEMFSDLSPRIQAVSDKLAEHRL